MVLLVILSVFIMTSYVYRFIAEREVSPRAGDGEK